MIGIVPTSFDPQYTQITAIDGTDYSLSLFYNTRQATWFLTIGEADGVPIVEGIPLVTGWDLLGAYRYLDIPKGVLAVIASGSDTSVPGIDELGEGLRTALYYRTP